MLERVYNFFKDHLTETFSLSSLAWGFIQKVSKWVFNKWYSRRKEVITVLGMFTIAWVLIRLESIKLYKPSPKIQMNIMVILVCTVVVLCLYMLSKQKKNKQVSKNI